MIYSYLIAYMLFAVAGLIAVCAWWLLFPHEPDSIGFLISVAFFAAFIIWTIFFGR